MVGRRRRGLFIVLQKKKGFFSILVFSFFLFFQLLPWRNARDSLVSHERLLPFLRLALFLSFSSFRFLLSPRTNVHTTASLLHSTTPPANHPTTNSRHRLRCQTTWRSIIYPCFLNVCRALSKSRFVADCLTGVSGGEEGQKWRNEGIWPCVDA